MPTFHLVTSKQQLAGPGDKSRVDAVRMFDRIIDQLCMAGRLPRLNDDQRNTLSQEAFLVTLEMLGADEAQEKNRSAQKKGRNERKRQKLSPPEGPMLTSESVDPALGPRTPAPATTPPAVQNQGQAQGTMHGPDVASTLQMSLTFPSPEAQEQELVQDANTLFLEGAFHGNSDFDLNTDNSTHNDDYHLIYGPESTL